MQTADSPGPPPITFFAKLVVNCSAERPFCANPCVIWGNKTSFPVSCTSLTETHLVFPGEICTFDADLNWWVDAPLSPLTVVAMLPCSSLSKAVSSLKSLSMRKSRERRSHTEGEYLEEKGSCSEPFPPHIRARTPDLVEGGLLALRWDPGV